MKISYDDLKKAYDDLSDMYDILQDKYHTLQKERDDAESIRYMVLKKKYDDLLKQKDPVSVLKQRFEDLGKILKKHQDTQSAMCPIDQAAYVFIETLKIHSWSELNENFAGYDFKELFDYALQTLKNSKQEDKINE